MRRSQNDYTCVILIAQLAMGFAEFWEKPAVFESLILGTTRANSCGVDKDI